MGDERAAIRVAINDTRRLLDADEEAANINQARGAAGGAAGWSWRPRRTRWRRVELEAQLADLDGRIGKADEPRVPVAQGRIRPTKETQEKAGRIVTGKDGRRGEIVSESADAFSVEWRDGTTSDVNKSDIAQRSTTVTTTRKNLIQTTATSGGITIIHYGPDGQIVYDTTVPSWKDAEVIAKGLADEHNLAGYEDPTGKFVEPTVPIVRDTAADVAKIESVPLADKPETAPLNQVVEEKAVRITQGTPFVEDRARLLDFVRNGKEAFMQRTRA